MKVHSSDEMLDSLRTVTTGPPSLLVVLLLPSANQRNSASSASGLDVPMIWPPKPTAMDRCVFDSCVPQ
jgi:hypothetical protein